MLSAAKMASNWVMGAVLKDLNERKIEIAEFPVKPQAVAELIALIDAGTVSSTMGQKLMQAMIETGESAEKIARERGMAQISDTSARERVVDGVIAASPKQLAEYRGGKKTVFAYFIGQVMKETKGAANPQVIREVLTKKLEG